jgi:hypothetical protein
MGSPGEKISCTQRVEPGRSLCSEAGDGGKILVVGRNRQKTTPRRQSLYIINFLGDTVTVLRIRDILVRIRIRRSIPLIQILLFSSVTFKMATKEVFC